MTLLQKHRSPGQLNIARILLFSVSSTKQFLLLKPAWTTGASNQNSSLMCAHRWPLRYVSSHLTRFQCHSEQPLLPLLSAVSKVLPKRTYYCILSFCCQELPLLPLLGVGGKTNPKTLRGPRLNLQKNKKKKRNPPSPPPHPFHRAARNFPKANLCQNRLPEICRSPPPLPLLPQICAMFTTYKHSGCPSKVGQPECSDFI